MNNIVFVLILLLICISLYGGKKKNHDDYLDRDTTTCLKGAAAIMVLIHHVEQTGIVSRYFVPLGYIGFITVSIFFFLSGYGLTYGYYNKKEYLKGFLNKHLLSIYIPYWLVMAVVTLIHFLTERNFEWKTLVITMLGFSEHWFVTAIIVFYVFFYLSFRFMDRDEAKLICLSILVVGYIIVCQCLPIISSYNASAASFVLGVIWYRYKDACTGKIREPHFLPVVTILFLVLFVGRLGAGQLGIGNEIVHTVLRNIISVVFVILIMTLLQYYRIRKNWLLVPGKVSFEIYLINGSLLPVLRQHSFLIYLLLTVCCTYALYKATNLVKGGIKHLWI